MAYTGPPDPSRASQVKGCSARRRLLNPLNPKTPGAETCFRVSGLRVSGFRVLGFRVLDFRA